MEKDIFIDQVSFFYALQGYKIEYVSPIDKSSVDAKRFKRYDGNILVHVHSSAGFLYFGCTSVKETNYREYIFMWADSNSNLRRKLKEICKIKEFKFFIEGYQNAYNILISL